MTLEAGRALLDVSGIEAVVKVDRHGAVFLLYLRHTLPEGILGGVGPKALDDLRDIGRGVAGRRLEASPHRGLVEMVEVRDHLTLRPILGLRHLGPPRLQEGSQIPALPTAHLEGAWAPGMERAPQRGRHGIGNLTTGQLPRDRSRGVGFRNRSKQT